MIINTLKANHFRCFDHLDLSFHDQVNFFVGANGAGKTSVLEALSVLTTGKSFRAHQQYVLFSFGHKQFWLSSSISSPLDSQKHLLGLSKDRRTNKSEKITHSVFKVDGVKQNKLSDYASMVPCVIIDSTIFDLVDGGGHKRRQLLDMILFHVEQGFYQVWSQLNKALEHKKALLKEYLNISNKRNQIDKKRCMDIEGQIKYWNSLISDSSNKIDDYRQGLIDKLMDKHSGVLLDRFIKDDQRLKISFHRYADDYEHKLDQVYRRELLLGKVLVSCNKSDVEIFFNEQDAKTSCSRGEKKLITCCLYALIVDYLKAVNKSPIVLIDDLPAEFDFQNQKNLLKMLVSFKVQLFISAIDAHELTSVLEDNEFKLFHVEQLKKHKQEVEKFHVEQ